jgi:hypothetical protein
MRGVQKYRPYFSAPELLLIIEALKEKSTPSRLALIKYLETFSIKIERGVLEPSITLDPSLEQKLGFIDRDTEGTFNLTEQELYEHWRNPTIAKVMTARQIKHAMDYAYRNDLLTPTEEEEYERSYGIH